jgi:hypothetical protein
MALTYAQRRELDTLIHRHVLGWEKFRDQPELHDGQLHTTLCALKAIAVHPECLTAQKEYSAP